jgi:hypothetical protein
VSFGRATWNGQPVEFDPVTLDMTSLHRDALDAQIARSVETFRKMAGGVTPRTCSLCGYHGMFSAYGMPPRLDARCGKCCSLERHRLFGLLVQRREDLFSEKDHVLHFAPEHQLRRLIRPLVARYETADIRAQSRIDHVVDIENLALPSHSYSRVVANHVLEHVDDSRALSEIFRILKPGGAAILSCPVVEGWGETYENPLVTEAEDRIVHFGQSDHLRYFGRDIRDRIRGAGFALEEFTAVEPDVRIHGLIRGETLFIAWRPSDDPRHQVKPALRNPGNG